MLDDDDAFRNSISEFLETNGSDVFGASSIAEASALLKQNQYDVIIVDVNLKSDALSGDEFILRNQELTRGATKVVISGFSMDRIRHRAELERSGIRIIQKGSRIIEQLRQVIQERKQTDVREKEWRSEGEWIAMGLFGQSVKLVSLTPDGTYRFIDEGQNLHRIVYVAPSETFALQQAIEELESLINDPRAKEQDFQSFFERNPNFILNEDYKKAHPHIVLTEEDGYELIPDFVLEPLDQNALSDVLELKLPSAQVFVLKKSRMRFSSAVLEAAAQLREYGVFFDESRNREAIKEKYGLLAYKPRMFVLLAERVQLARLM
ncbi:MAG: hypothetical protein DMF72_18470 [Acidobacteria bacterium]|nr:MAG: hypothetical protein DMF72_18470 [Acidobacteriota bacterium]